MGKAESDTRKKPYNSVKFNCFLTNLMYFCRVLINMTITESILNYASRQKGAFKRKDLINGIVSKHPSTTEKAIDIQTSRLLNSGKLQRKGHGQYMLAENILPEFVYHPSEFEKDIFLQLKKKFPFLDICIWSPKVLSSFMHHIPNIGYTFVDVEKDGMESVFHALLNMNTGRHILLAPSVKDCERYLVDTDTIVVRQLIGQSPLTEIDGCTVPRIEKILVDAIGDNELMFASGSEIYNIYEFVRERHSINMSKLNRYASRRNRKDKVQQIIATIGHDKSEE